MIHLRTLPIVMAALSLIAGAQEQVESEPTSPDFKMDLELSDPGASSIPEASLKLPEGLPDDLLMILEDQSEEGAGGGTDAGQAAMQADKSGTNPINFTFDLRNYNELQWLNTAGDGFQNINTTEFRMPFADGKWQFRIKVPLQYLEADFNGDGIDDVDEFGLGDINFRLLTVPIMNMEKKFALAVGTEVFLDTATDPALGTGAWSLGPQVFGVFFKPFGGFFDLIAPAYQHRFSIAEDSGRSPVHQGLIDVFALKMSKDKQAWGLLNPTMVFDFENDKQFLLIDAEVGTMVDKLLGTTGHSIYARPGTSIGAGRPTDFSLEFGYKIIW